VEILRKVISTRPPIATVAGSTSVSSQRKRPPPSKSTTAATTGGFSEYARRSLVNVATVARESARRSWVTRSTAPQELQTRAGGRCRVPHCSQRLAVKPNFHSSCRNEGGAAGEVGSGRRGGSRCS